MGAFPLRQAPAEGDHPDPPSRALEMPATTGQCKRVRDRDDPSPHRRHLDRLPFSPAALSDTRQTRCHEMVSSFKVVSNKYHDTNPKPRREIPAGIALKDFPAPLEAGRRTGWQTTFHAAVWLRPVGRSCLACVHGRTGCRHIRPTATRFPRLRAMRQGLVHAGSHPMTLNPAEN